MLPHFAQNWNHQKCDGFHHRQSNSRKVPKQTTQKAREELFGKEFKRIDQPQHMAKLINYALSDIMLRYKNTLVFGEDGAQKGGVYM
ncbi:MAG: hypothetical protein Ct9H300mP9_1180 [Candidatus Neomarinimicrobiota bacterium]|nr:MAG: hypothetical protein Ct9H300mP9_1180 [Candidatus Neomarinimicrobiota bacterium]